MEVEKVKKVVMGLLIESRVVLGHVGPTLKKNLVSKWAGKKCTRELWIK
jgi:hypothetical protein